MPLSHGLEADQRPATLAYTPEIQPVLAERDRLTPGERAMSQALTLNGFELSAVLGQFHKAKRELLSACLPHERSAITAQLDYYEWRHLGQPGEPVPDSLVLDHATKKLVPRDTEAFRRSVVVHDALGESELIEDVLMSYEYMFERNVKAVEAAVRLMVSETDDYAYLHALLSDAPQPLDVPLSLAERAMREAHEDDAIRKKYGIDRDDTLHMHPAAHHDLQRRVLRLDDETNRRRTNKDTTSYRNKLEALFLEIYNRGLTGGEHDPKMTRMYMDGDTLMYELENGETDVADDRFLLDYTTTARMRLELQDGTYNEAIYTESLLAYTIAEVFSERSHGVSLDELLGRAAERCLLYKPKIANHAFSDLELLKLRGVTAPTVHIPDALQVFRSRVRRHYSDSVRGDVVSQYEAQDAAERTVGHVAGASHLLADRVITIERLSKSIPSDVPEHYDLMIQMENWYGAGSSIRHDVARLPFGADVPAVPGFDIVAARAGQGVVESYLVRSSVDPYAEAERMTLPEDAQQKIITFCDDIGLRHAAESLRRIPDATLATVADIFAASSDYTYDYSKEFNFGSGDYYWETMEIKDNIVDAKTGRLQVQCTGAASVLQLALRTALPGDVTVQSVSGKAADGARVTAAGHEQTRISIFGDEFIIDSTPSNPNAPALIERRGTGIGGFNGYGDTVVKQYTRMKQVTFPKPGQLTPQSAPLLDIIGMSDELMPMRQPVETIANAEGRLMGLLGGYFDVPIDSSHDALFDLMARRNAASDPMRHALEAVLIHQSADAPAHLQAVSNYLAHVIDADDALLRRAGVPRYDASVLQSVRGIVDDLHGAVVQQRANTVQD